MKNVKKWLTGFAMTLLVLFGATAFGQTTEAKELTNVLSDIIIWDNSNGREASKKDGAYDLVIGNNYSFDTKFDLSAYNSNVSDGDFFTFTVPAPFTVKNGATIELNDPETKVAIADAVIASNGAGQGGKVTITMKNLHEYLDKKKATEVLNVKGSFFTAFSAEAEQALTTKTFTNIKDTTTKEISFKVSKRQVTDNTEAVGKENFAKYAGVIKSSGMVQMAVKHQRRMELMIWLSGITIPLIPNSTCLPTTAMLKMGISSRSQFQLLSQ